MRVSFFLGAPVLSLLVALSSCASVVRVEGTPEAADGGASDGGALGEGSAPNPVSAVYPAAHSAIPLVTYNGGDVIDAPKLVTITYAGDALRTTAESFGATITTTAWWDAVSREYCDARGKCVGHGTGVNAELDTQPDTNYTDTAGGGASTLQTYLAARIADGSLPPPDAETIYVLYLPSTTTVNLDGAESCNEFAGYHGAMSAVAPGGSSPVQFAYAVVPRCSSSKDDLTFAASHEIVESATDPFLAPANQSYYAFGSDSDAWDYVSGGGEVGDRCVDPSGAGSDRYTEGQFVVQRTWSNLAAKASHDPCVPAPLPSAQPYFNIAPTGSDTLVMKVGDTQTVPLVAFSDAATDPFAVGVLEVTSYLGGTNVLDVAIDETSLQNGQKANVTVTLKANPTQGPAAFVVTSQLGQVQHAWPFVVTTQ